MPKGIGDYNLGSGCLAGPRALDPNYCKTTNPLIAGPLSGGSYCAWVCAVPV